MNLLFPLKFGELLVETYGMAAGGKTNEPVVFLMFCELLVGTSGRW